MNDVVYYQLRNLCTFLFLGLFISFTGVSQEMQVEVLGGAVVTHGSTITINAGSALTFRITNTRSNCGTLKVQSITLGNPADFSKSHKNLPKNVKSVNCNKGRKKLDFTVTNSSDNCSVSTLITIKNNKDTPDFSFTLIVNSSPEIYVLGGSPLADINDGSTTTSATNGTYFGVVDEGSSVTRRFAIANIGSCPLDISSAISSNPDFVITTPHAIPWDDLESYTYIVIDVTFTAPALASGAQTSTISIGNSDTTPNDFKFNVSAEMFDFNIPGPGGVTADFRLWLKSTRGIKFEPSTSDKVRCWLDLGTNGKNAEQLVAVNQPTFLDDQASNINFNPVIKFENDGGSLNQYLKNNSNGFYTQEIFIVMEPDVDVATSSGMTIFSGTVAVNSYLNSYLDDVDDFSGIGLGNFTNRITSPEEKLWYNQGNSVSNPYYTLLGSNSRSYNNAGIINARNKSGTASDGMTLLYNSYDDGQSATKSAGFTSENLGYIDTTPNPDIVWGTPYNIGTNANSTFGNLNGRVAEIFTFAERLNDLDKNKIESYLAIKYGITLGGNTEAEKDYINSVGTKIWDESANNGYNFNVAGIGRDDSSDLNQKQSKSLNEVNEVTIGLGGIFTTNSTNTNEFIKDGDFLVWGCNNAAFTSSGTNTVTITITTGITTSLTRINRKWKIEESKVDANGDVETVYVAIPSTAFSSFSKNADEEYVLIVSDTENFTNSDIIDVIPLKEDADSNLQTWYDFDGTKFFTFGKASRLTGSRLVNFVAGDYLVGERDLNLGVDSFTISAWIKSAPSANTRTIMSKGSKLQFRLNSINKIEVLSDDDITPKFTSNIAINDSKWHQISMVYDSGTILLYIDGILDKSVQNIVHPSINYNRYSIGALYLSKDNIINPFLGEIDEVYVWDIGLTGEQVRYLMNQEIEKGTGDLVSGTVLPMNALSNELSSIPWSKLKVYYNFNSFYGSTIEGLTDDRNFLRLKYLAKDKSIVDTQTSPLPYISAADGDWDSVSTWVNGAVINLPNSIGLDGSTYVDWNIVETSHNIASGDRDISVLGLKNNAGKITIADPNESQDETNSGQGLAISHYLELDGVIDLVGESQLVQDEGSILDEDSGGYIKRDQQGTASSFNYNDWSSSVGPLSGNTATRGTGVSSTNSNYSVSGFLNDGTNSATPQSIVFSSSHAAADSGTVNPITLSSYWLYTFNALDNDYHGWVSINENSTLIPGEGFTMKGSSGSADVSDNQNYAFIGKPYNGDFTLPIAAGNARLIGNPYPSAMDADQFILDNISETINSQNGNNTVNVFNGALYFWHHFAKSTHNLADYEAGYATYTLMGGTQAYATDSRLNNTGNSGGKIPERYIPVNQGFVVVAALDASLVNTTTAVSGGDIIFKNSQRVFERERFTGTNTGSLFFKTNKKSKENVVNDTGDDRAKIRLKFNSQEGYHRQLLVGVDNSATNSFDIGYDAPIADLNKDDIFWVFNKSKFVIQAVNNFDKNQELPIGIKLEKDGLVSIKIDSVENIDPSFKIYIKDKETNKISLINEQPFELKLVAGEYLERFALTFNSGIIEEEDDIVVGVVAKDTGVQVYMNNKVSKLQIKNFDKIEITEIQLFNYLGQTVGNWKEGISETEFSIPVKKATGTYIVKLTTGNGILNKKIIIN